MAKTSAAQIKAAQKWQAANVDRLSLVVPKGERDKIKTAAAAAGESVNAFIIEAIRARMAGAVPAAEIVQAAQPVAEAQPVQAAGGDGLTLPAKVARLARQAAKMAGDADALTWVTRALEAAAGAEIEAQEHRRAALDLLEMARNGGKSAPTSAPSIAPPDKKIARDPGASCMVPGVGAVDWAERTARVRQLREDAERQKHIAEQPPVENPEPEQTAPGNSGDLLSEQAGPKTPGD